MRIISGKYKGKVLKGFNIKGTRPTMDRVKESLFASIQTKLPNANCLDLFAGSGSLGIEALSNGSKHCTFVDDNPQVLKTLKLNTLNINEVTLIKQDFLQFLKHTNETYDVIFLDPPYHKHLIQPSLNIIFERQLLNEDGIIICEYEDEIFKCPYPIWKEKKYGSIYVKILKK